MGGTFTRSRNLEPLPVCLRVTNSGAVHQDSPISQQTRPTQTTTSYRGDRSVKVGEDLSHAQLRAIYQDRGNWATYSKYDTGHPFETSKQSIWTSHPNVFVRPVVPGSKARYMGPLVPTSAGSLVHGYNAFPSIPIDALGSKAIADTRPNDILFDSANFYGELYKDGLPSIFGTMLDFKSKAHFFKSLGKEYLNSVFAWTPFVRSLQDALDVVAASDRLVYQFLRDNGKDIRRKRVYPNATSITDAVTGYVMTNAFSLLGSDYSDLFQGSRGGRGAVRHIHTRQVKFTSKYSYYLGDPSGDVLDNIVKYASLARRLAGIRLTPSTLWELAPWSWLVDWHANIGQVLANADSLSADNLILKYGYLTVVDDTSRELTTTSHNIPAFGPVTVAFRQRRIKRFRAYPYGFTLSPSAYTAEQWAVIGALLSTKTPTSLR